MNTAAGFTMEVKTVNPNASKMQIFKEQVNRHLLDVHVEIENDIVYFSYDMLKSVEQASVVSPEFLEFCAYSSKITLRQFAAGHPNTLPEALAYIAAASSSPSSSIEVYTALENPHMPFREAFIAWRKIVPTVRLNELPCVLERKEEYLSMLAEHGLTAEDVKTLPAEWVMQGLILD